jgi:coenzyme F420-0:L-glutamate ligase / coenzyme F420-1:gamma-L-glutamate ligase
MAKQKRLSLGEGRTAPSTALSVFAIPGFPEIRSGCDLAGEIARAARRAGIEFQDGDILVVAQKVVSKCEGRMVRLSQVKASKRALELAE